MRIPRIYSPQNLGSDGPIALEAAASHYLGRVLRLQPGRELIVFNGQGGEYRATLESIDKRSAVVQITSYCEINRCPAISTELAIALSKGEKMEWLIQKACELGVTRIVPLFGDRSEVKLSGDRLHKKLNHWRNILISSCEQCQRNLIPEICAPENTTNYIQHCQAELKLVLHHRSAQTLTDISSALQTPPSSVILLIGPEGGLSEDEIQLAATNNFDALKLGPRILRTETAPLLALGLVQQLWGDLND